LSCDHVYDQQVKDKGASKGGAKRAEVPLLAKSKLRKKIKYRIVLIFLCLSELKLRDLANSWS